MNTAARLLAALDHTRFDPEDSPESIRRHCADAAAGPGRPAAVCVYPVHAAVARAALDAADAANVAVAAVANFPDGGDDPARALKDIRRALAAGSAEIDLVIPWRSYLAGDRSACTRMLAQCREATAGRLLKVIVESGDLRTSDRIRELASLALDAGADFIKTSTGKTPIGATPEAVRTILDCLKARGHGGLKVSGGIRTLSQAAAYLELTERVCGADWATPVRFRIGSSSLLAAIRAA
jgi:deoxyribose-phosphate aldolase